MNKAIINNWNICIKKRDEIFHLGDFAFGNYDSIKTILGELNGNIHLCIGSHDKEIRKHRKELIEEGYVKEIEYIYEIKVYGTYVFMSHYLHKIWPRSHYNSWHLFGHSHGRMNSYAEKEGKLLDVGVDSHNYFPVAHEEVIKFMKNRPDNPNLVY